MKFLQLSIVFMLLSANLLAQNTDVEKTKETKKDTSILRMDGKEIIIIEEDDDFDERYENWDPTEKNEKNNGCCDFDWSWDKEYDGHWAGIELGINNYLNKDFAMKVPDDGKYMELDDSRSLEFSLNVVDIALPIVEDRFGVITGLGFSWNNYKFDNKQVVLQNDGDELYVDTVTEPGYSKNKLATWYMNVPLMLEYQQPIGDHHFWVALGGYGGLKLGSHTKLKTNDGNKTKVRKDFHLNTLRYGLRAHIGFNSFGLYCNYSLQSLFKKNEGPELYPLSLGVTLSF